MVRLFDQGQPAPVQPQVRVVRDKVVQLDPQVSGDTLQFAVGQWNLTGPAAAIPAALARVVHAFFHVVNTHVVTMTDFVSKRIHQTGQDSKKEFRSFFLLY